MPIFNAPAGASITLPTPITSAQLQTTVQQSLQTWKNVQKSLQNLSVAIGVFNRKFASGPLSSEPMFEIKPHGRKFICDFAGAEEYVDELTEWFGNLGFCVRGCKGQNKWMKYRRRHRVRLNNKTAILAKLTWGGAA